MLATDLSDLADAGNLKREFSPPPSVRLVSLLFRAFRPFRTRSSLEKMGRFDSRPARNARAGFDLHAAIRPGRAYLYACFGFRIVDTATRPVGFSAGC